MSRTLENQVAIVTGAGGGTGGIGRTIAARLAALGAKLALSDMDGSTERTAGMIREANGGESDVLCHTGNLAEEAVVAELVAQTISQWGRIDILVNNAGGGIIQPFLEHTAESLVETINRNLWTTVWCCHRVLPQMVAQRYGRIINIGADSVRNGLWNHAGYNAAKGGVHGLTTGLAREFAAHDITVNTVAPCVVNTERYRATVEAGSAIAQQFTSIVPKGRPAELDEIASMIVYLAGPEAGFVTGQVISVNGGSTML